MVNPVEIANRLLRRERRLEEISYEIAAMNSRIQELIDEKIRLQKGLDR